MVLSSAKVTSLTSLTLRHRQTALSIKQSLFVGNKNPYYLGLKESKIERKYISLQSYIVVYIMYICIIYHADHTAWQYDRAKAKSRSSKNVEATSISYSTASAHNFIIII